MHLLLARRLPWQLMFIVSDRPREPSGWTSAQCLLSSNYQPSRLLYSPSLRTKLTEPCQKSKQDLVHHEAQLNIFWLTSIWINSMTYTAIESTSRKHPIMSGTKIVNSNVGKFIIITIGVRHGWTRSHVFCNIYQKTILQDTLRTSPGQ